jgi:translation initiation factor 1
MNDRDPITGLPKELGAWDTIVKEDQTITVGLAKRKFGKVYTVIKGLKNSELNLKDLCKKLKSKFACGGTAKDGVIELQGDHSKDMRAELISLGFSPDTIKVK